MVAAQSGYTVWLPVTRDACLFHPSPFSFCFFQDSRPTFVSSYLPNTSGLSSVTTTLRSVSQQLSTAISCGLCQRALSGLCASIVGISQRAPFFEPLVHNRFGENTTRHVERRCSFRTRNGNCPRSVAEIEFLAMGNAPVASAN
jgi:hypothetical protein